MGVNILRRIAICHSLSSEYFRCCDGWDLGMAVVTPNWAHREDSWAESREKEKAIRQIWNGSWGEDWWERRGRLLTRHDQSSKQKRGEESNVVIRPTRSFLAPGVLQSSRNQNPASRRKQISTHRCPNMSWFPSHPFM